MHPTPQRRATDTLPEHDDPLAFWPGLFWAIAFSALGTTAAVAIAAQVFA